MAEKTLRQVKIAAVTAGKALLDEQMKMLDSILTHGTWSKKYQDHRKRTKALMAIARPHLRLLNEMETKRRLEGRIKGAVA